MSNKPRVLLIDDGDSYAKMLLSTNEFELVYPDSDKEGCCLHDGPSALDFLKESHSYIDVILLDMNFDLPSDKLFVLEDGANIRRTRRFQGVAILREIRKLYLDIPVVLLTSKEDLSLDGVASDLEGRSMTYVLDGYDIDTLRVRINTAMTNTLSHDEDRSVLWGSDPAIKAVQRRLSVLSRGSMPVIIEGDTGTGKSYLAKQYVHENSGRTGPFVVLDLSSVPAQLVSAHLFGAVKGAYTGADSYKKGLFELADGGTLFIDEIQNVPLEIQKQLLGVLQEKKVRPLGASFEVDIDVKVIAASNKPLDEAVSRGLFRSDLYMRLSPATRVRIPSLRERMSDLDFFTQKFADKAFADKDASGLKIDVVRALGMKKDVPAFLSIGRARQGEPDQCIEIVIPLAAWKMLMVHSWPGNIRELEMLVYNIIVFTLVETLDAAKKHSSISSGRLQVDPGLVSDLLSGSRGLSPEIPDSKNTGGSGDICIDIESGHTLNEVAKSVERQYFIYLFESCERDFSRMAHVLLNDSSKARAVRLRFNQLGLKVRAMDSL